MRIFRLCEITLAALLAGAAASHAALAPNYQRARELTAVIDAVAALVDRHPIEQVLADESGGYRVVAGPCTVLATIVPEAMPDGMVGPMRFRVELAEPVCEE